MEASDELLTIAELAIGLAGFSGVVVAFSQRRGLRDADRFRFTALFFIAFSALVLAFVPFGFHHAGQAGPALWRGSSAVMLAWWICAYWLIGVRLRPDFPPDEQFSRIMSVAFWSPPILNGFLQVANVVGWPRESGVLLFLAGLILLLVTAGTMFANLVLFGAKD